MEQTPDKNPAHNRGHGINPLARHQRNHNRHKGKAGPLDDRKARANRAHAHRLDQCGNTSKDHAHLDHIDHHRKIR